MDFDWKINGNQYQATREGYNLLDFNVTQDNRVTYNEDGSITINGVGAFSLKFNQITLEANKTYKQKMQLISGTIKDSSGKDMKDSAIMSFSPNVWLNTTKSSTYSKAEETSKSSAWVHQDAIFDNAKIKIWAYEGTEDKPYEQYGASPSPDYPSEVGTVGGNINIFNKNDVMENAYLNSANGSTLSSSTSVTSNYIEINSNSNYVINGYGTNNYYKVVCYYDKNKNFISSITKTDTSNEFKISAPDGACYLRFHISKNSEEVKLEKGSIITSYSQYNQGSVEVKVVNKNFVKIDETIDFSISNVQFTCKDGKLNVNGTSNANISSVNNNFKNYFKFVLPAGSYTYSQKNSVNSNIFTYILDLEDTSKRYATTNGNSVKKVSFTLEKTTEVFVGMYSGSNVTFNNVEIELQIERGSTTTDFVEHQEQAITMPVQQEMLSGDYIADVEHHEWGKIESYNGEIITTDYISTTGELTTGATVYYKLAEPIDLELTSEQKAVRNQKLYTYKNITNISLSNELASIDVTYKKDLETMFNNIIKQIPSSTSDTTET